MLYLLLAFYIINIQIDAFLQPVIPYMYRFFYLWSNGYTILLIFLLQFLLIIKYYRINSCITWLISSFIIICIYYLYSDKLLIFNPLLYSPFMSIHPVLLYLSYSYMAVLFCIIFNNLLYDIFYLKKNNSSIIHSNINVFQYILNSIVFDKVPNNVLYFIVNISFLLNFISICIGGIWAYHELGWGGIWFFDPVENLSLLPFISILGVFHNKYKIETCAYWSTLNIISVILSIILVRSNLLNSIHAFATQINIYLIYISCIYILIILTLCLTAILYYNKLTSQQNKKDSTTFIFNNNLLLLMIYFIILTIIVYPIFIKYYYNQIVEISLSFFQNYFLGCIFIILFFMVNDRYCRLLISLFIFFKHIFVYLGILNNNFQYIDGMIIVLIGSIHALYNLYFKQQIARYIAHLGVFIMTLFSILYSNYTYEDIYYLNNNNIIYSQQENIIEQNVEFIYEGYQYIPRVLYYTYEKVIKSQIYTRYFFLYDIQVVILNIDKEVITLSVKKIFYVKQIFLGALMICLSYLLIKNRM